VPVIFTVFGLVIFAFFAAVHGTLVFHARSVVEAAAQDGLAAAQLEGGTEDDGRNAAFNTLNSFENLADRQVSVDINGADTEVRVRVSARITTLPIDLFADVSAEAVGPKERFYDIDERD
jgi:hypothetical protein